MGTQRIRVLVVEDASRKAGGHGGAVDRGSALTSASWVAEVGSVSSPSAALDRLAEEPIDCVVTAVELAGESGIELCRRVRTTDPTVSVVVHPEVGSERLAGEAVQAGCDAYVPSDADADDLRERVRRVTSPIEEDDGHGDGNTVEESDTGPQSRAELECELRTLRRSEELHRVTLNHMTDTVLVTDDAGEFTYVCPNVHFIFGYTDEQIHEMGTIDELLGPDLIDRDELAREGVLTNVECTATDQDGDEHALLVNAREVEIQGGTILYSCRDVTTRKRREEALTALHRTARRLVYAETRDEIAELVVADAADVLDLEASAVFVLDDGRLRPAAHSEPMERRCGTPRPFQVNEESPVGYSFLQRESLFFPGDGEAGSDREGTPVLPSEVVGSSLPANPDTDVESAAYVPLGEAGVFVAGSADADRFDDVSRELAELLSASAAAALGRVDRESELRAQDRALQRQNRRLSRLDLINEVIREIDAALVRAETREEIERAVCERLTDADRFAFAWIGTPSPEASELEVRARDGDGRGYLDEVALNVDGGAEPACRTAASGTVSTASNVADELHTESWRQAALARDFQSACSVPLAYDEYTYGVLTVYADRPNAFDEVSRPVLEELGETIASAMGAIERKSALLTASSTRLEFVVDDDGSPFGRLAAAAGRTISFDGGVRQTADGAWLFATVDGGPVSAVADAARDLVAIEECQVITEDDDGGTIRLELSGPVLALRLADHGIVLDRLEASPEGTRLVVDVPTGVDVRSGVTVVESAFETVRLVSKATVERTTARDLRSAVVERLTERQLEVVQVAYYSGFFEEPRATTGEAVADTLDISPAAFYRHNRTVQRKLFEALFDGRAPTPPGRVE